MVWRVFLLLVGIGIMSFGVSLTVVAGIGTTTNSSLPVALAAITDLSVGQLTIVFNFVYVAVQILLMRSRYQWIQLLQLVTGLIFGLLIDATAPLVEPLRPEHYWQELSLALIGVVGMGIGIGMQVGANLINLPGEGFVVAITSALRRRFGPRPRLHFGTVKTVSDLVHVAVAAALGLIFLGHLEGVREATIIAALSLGAISKTVLNRLPHYPPIVRPKE